MDTRMPDGSLLREKFETMEELRKRQKELEKQGGVTERILAAVEDQAAIEKLPTDVSSSKYEPHQGQAEMQRRLRKSQA